MTTKIPVELSSTPGIVDGSNATAITIDSSERVGIGTTSPSNNLHVTGSGSTPFATQRDVNSGGFAMLQGKMGDSASTTAGHAYSALVTGIEDNTNGAEDGYFAVEVSEGGSGSEKLRIKSNGNVGIGTTSPLTKFHVHNGSDAENILIVTGADTTTEYISLGTSSGVGVLKSGHSGAVATSLAFETAASNGAETERMRIDGSGNVGIGTSSPSGKLHVDSSATTEILFEGTKTSDGAIVDISFRNGSDSIAAIQALRVSNNDQADMAFFTQPNSGTVTERMRIESTGDVRFNIANAALTAAEVHTFNNAGRGNNLGLYTTGADQHFSIDMWNHTGGSCNQVQFRGGGSGAVTGTITSTGNNATQYNTSSDYRLKENVDYTWDATTRLKQLKPVRFNWIDDDTNTLEDGFLAHEVSSVVPNAVRGEKDDVYTEEEASDDMHINAGDIKRQQLDHSKLVPLLVKTIQELEARITTLEGE